MMGDNLVRMHRASSRHLRHRHDLICLDKCQTAICFEFGTNLDVSLIIMQHQGVLVYSHRRHLVYLCIVR